MSIVFTEEDREIMAKKGETEQEVLDQIDLFIKGPTPIALKRPCVLGDGIKLLDDMSTADLLKRFDEARSAGRVMNFIPASGAASRMFEKWFRLNESPDSEEVKKFLRGLPRYPFYNSLIEMLKSRGIDPSATDEPSAVKEIIDCILGENGLNLGALPKALIPFHRYSDEDTRTPIEEHLIEAALYIADKNGICRIHFTVSPEHMDAVEGFIEKVRPGLEKRLGVRFKIKLSPQHSLTDTLAVDLKNKPFRDESGNLLFRPGGHGALLKNLDDLGGDIVFIKNIDNIAPDRLKGDIVFYKKLLGGYLLDLQDKIFEYLRLLEKGCDEKSQDEIEAFCRESLNFRPPRSHTSPTAEERAERLFKVLNRPIRVCGMVRNEGEPGGGPFWVDEGDGGESLQIVEGNQVDKTSEDQRAAWESSTHFNPVDLVCGLRDYRGRQFKLNRYLDPETFIITEKSFRGKPIKALELPGLWNGSMARWNTVFVEVPVFTFTPVKTVEDLLRKEHTP